MKGSSLHNDRAEVTVVVANIVLVIAVAALGCADLFPVSPVWLGTRGIPDQHATP